MSDTSPGSVDASFHSYLDPFRIIWSPWMRRGRVGIAHPAFGCSAYSLSFFPFMKCSTMSIGTGNTIVEFFSTAISLSVWRKRS